MNMKWNAAISCLSLAMSPTVPTTDVPQGNLDRTCYSMPIASSREGAGLSWYGWLTDSRAIVMYRNGFTPGASLVDILQDTQKPAEPLTSTLRYEDIHEIRGIGSQSKWLLGTAGASDDAVAVGTDGHASYAWKSSLPIPSSAIVNRDDMWAFLMSTGSGRRVVVASIGHPVRTVELSGNGPGQVVGITPERRLLTLDHSSGNTSSTPVLREYDLQNGAAGRSWRVALPRLVASRRSAGHNPAAGELSDDVWAEEVVLSPNGAKLAWLLGRPIVESKKPGGDVNGVDDIIIGRQTEVWVSRSDGSEMRQLAQDVAYLNPPPDMGLATIRTVHWLPGESAVSFIKVNTLHVVPSDGLYNLTPGGVIYSIHQALEVKNDIQLRALCTPRGYSSLQEAVQKQSGTAIAMCRTLGGSPRVWIPKMESDDSAVAFQDLGQTQPFARLIRIGGRWKMDEWLEMGSARENSKPHGHTHPTTPW